MKNRLWSHLMVSFRQHVALTMMTVLVLTGSFLVMGGFLLLGHNLEKVLTLWGESMQMSIYLKEGATSEQSQRLLESLKKDDRIGKVQFVDRVQALASFQQQMASYAPDLIKDVDLLKFIPESFQVQLSDVVSAAQQLDVMNELTQSLKLDPLVDEVGFGQEWVKTYASIVQTFQGAGLWIMVVILFAALFVVTNAISTSIYQRKNEIEVLELVGASKLFIRGPFLFEGFLLSTGSAVLSLLGLLLGYELVIQKFSGQISLLQLSQHLAFLSPGTIFVFLLSAGLLGLVSAALSLRRINDGWAASKSQGAP